MRNIKFSTNINAAFAAALKQRVNLYFSERSLSRNANSEMVLKTISAFAIYLIPYFLMIIAGIDNIILLFLLWILMGFGKAFIGTSVMHDTIHGSYTKNKPVKQLLTFSTWLLGIEASLWNIQHNVLHHTFTNIEGADEDIDSRFILRFSPNQPRRWFHRYQHIYALFIYSIMTLFWFIAKDFIKAVSYQKKGLLRNQSFAFFITTMVAKKLLYLVIFIFIPVILLPIATYWVLLMFIVMHLTAGILLSMIFQPAHVMESSSFFVAGKDKLIKENWLVHQLRTTTNFGMNSKILYWFSGGLNFQIEHHLFPNICHVHYKKISKIVKATALEYGLPYHIQPTFGLAICNHIKMLRALGTGRI